MKVLILGGFSDAQTGIYIMESFRKYSSDVAAVDIRRIVEEIGANGKSQDVIISEIKDLKIEPDLILVLKGLEIMPQTLTRMRAMYPKAKIVNWMFDKYIGELPAWQNKPYLDYIKMYDRLYCSLEGVAIKLKEIGLKNVDYLPEAAHPDYNGEIYVNSYQQSKYGEDVSFVGSLGYFAQHSNRIPTLSKVAKEGFNLKIWGNVVVDWKRIPREVKQCHALEEAVNERHSKVAQCSLINLGIDQDPELELSQSARMYRVMCAGGLYLTTYVKNLENMFNINKDGEKITEDQDLVVYYDVDDLIEKLDYLLEHDELREKIRRNGQRKVYEKHTFEVRVKELLDKVKVI